MTANAFEEAMDGSRNSPPTTRDRLKSSIPSRDKSMPIAVIGMGFRGPADATNVKRLWKMILESREGWCPIPKTRWNNSAFYHPDNTRHGTINVEGGHFMTEDPSLFDAPFFNMTGDEAAAMDPQQRLLLEVTYESLENAGIPLPNIMGTKTACFVASFSADYMDLLLRDPESVPMYQCTNAGQSRAMTANRVSYFFDLKGPSVTVDTACSGSLVALHLACQSLRTGDASLAIAAGVNVILSHEFMSTMSMMKFLSPDGRCHTFDESANGYARGEGIGCLILKPLVDAVRDGDMIRAVIRGSGSNQDGRTPGITLPSGALQEVLIRDVYDAAGLNPLETEIIETHGTGTQAGDPIETGALSEVFGPGRPPSKPLRIGSIKTNVGHLEGTSGVAGVIKAVLMLENRIFLPNRNLRALNPRIPLQEWNLKVQLHPEPWETPGPHRVSVNSFGYGGSNAHIVLEDAPGYLSERGIEGIFRKANHNGHHTQLSDGEDSKNGHWQASNGTRNVQDVYRSRLFVVSGFDEGSCSAQIQNLHEYLSERSYVADDCFMDNLAFTLNERRSKFMWKGVVTGGSPSSVAEALSSRVKPRRAIKRPSIGFVFTGQGAQWCGMGKELWATYPVFRRSIERIDEYLGRIGAPFSVEEEILRGQDSSRLSHPLLSQPICSALQIALVDLLVSWGIFPDSVTGHSSGEIAAAYAVGALCMEDAMSAAYHRGAIAGKLPAIGSMKGAMLAVGMSTEDIQPYLDTLRSGRVVVACENSPSSLTVSGDLPAIEELERLLREKQVFVRRLAVDVAYHSHHMELIGDEYHTAISHIKTRGDEDSAYRQTVSFFSSVTGREVNASQLGPQYWVRNLLGQVKFAESLQALCFETRSQKYGPGVTNGKRAKRAGAARKVSVDYLVEIGPHSALAGPIKQILKADSKLGTAKIIYGSVLLRNADAVSTALTLAASLAASGCALSFDAVNRATDALHKEPQLLVDLPPYAWNHRKSYWAEPRLSKTFRTRRYPRTDLLGVSDKMSCPFEPRWRNFIRVSEIPWLSDHKIQSNIVYPAAGYIVMAIEASSQHVLEQSLEITGYQLHDVSILSALVINEALPVEVLVSLKPSELYRLDTDGRWFEFHVYSVTVDNRWTEHSKGFVGVQFAGSSDDTIAGKLTKGVQVSNLDLRLLDVDKFYDKLANIGLEYGPSFANMTKAHFADDRCFAEISIPDTAAAMPMNFQHPFVVHPCTLDSTFHSIFVPLLGETDQSNEPPVPVFIDQIYISHGISSAPGVKMEVQTHIGAEEGRDIVASLSVMDQDSGSDRPVVAITGLRCRRLADDTTLDVAKPVDRIAYDLKWEADPDALISQSRLKLLSEGTASDGAASTLPLEKSDLYDACALYYVKRALASLAATEVTAMKPHIKRLWSFFTEVGQPGNSTIAAASPRNEIDLVRLRNASPKGKLLYALGEHLPSILTSGIDITGDSIFSTYWDNAPHLVQGYGAAARYLAMVGHKNPNISVLELATGSGGASLIYLQHLTGAGGITRCAEYTFTHQDASTFENAARRLEGWRNLTIFRTLDIERHPEDQGFGLHGYDVVIVSQGLSTSASRHHALKNIRCLVRPNGYLIIIDPFTNREAFVDSVVFGHLPGWWPSDQKAALSDGIFKSEWNPVLLEAGFSETERLECKPGGSQDSCSLVVTRPLKDVQPASVDALVITEGGECGVSVSHLHALLGPFFPNVELSDMINADPIGRICVVLSDLKLSLFTRPNKMIFEKLKRVFLQSAGVLWVTRGGSINPTNPDAGLVVGFARTARSESGVNPIVTLDLNGQKPASDQRAAKIISDLIRYRFLESNTTNNDVEYVEKDGVLLIPRVVENARLNQAIASLHVKMPTEQAFHQSGRRLRAPIERTGGSESVYFVDDPSTTELPEDHISIEVRAFGFSSHGPKKILTFGSGCSGVVNSVGSAVHNFARGDRVVCLASGPVTNIYHDHESMFQRIPASMSFEMAAVLTVPYCTAYYIVDRLARVSPEDTVLIIGAEKTDGQAMIELCHWKGVRTFATVATESQRGLLSARLRIPESQVFTGSGELDSLNGIDTVINCCGLTDKAARFAWKCISPYGRFIQIGEKVTETPRSKRHIMYSSFDILDFCRQRPTLVSSVWKNVVHLIDQGMLEGPSPVKSHGISNLDEVMKLIERRAKDDPITITAGMDDLIKASLPERSNALFRPDVSYMLVGGLGGIGRAAALWMADHGARNLIFVNRSGLSNPASQATVDALKEKEVNTLVHACNVSDQVQIQNMLFDLTRTAPPIRGVIQAAMVVKDVHIEKMTVEDYHAVLQPKYAATWNLHRFLPSNLDFFLMLSSISGVIGNATQSAYAAGSAFMDSFAAYRNSIGLPAVSLDLGMITDVGYLAENKELASRMAQQGFQGTDTPTLMSLIQMAISEPGREGASSQVITGLGEWKEGRSLSNFDVPLFAHFRHQSSGNSESQQGESAETLREDLRQAKSVDEAAGVICNALSGRIAAHLSMPMETINPSSPISEYRIDSHVAVELRNWISKKMESTIPILEILSSGSLLELAAKIAAKSNLIGSSS